VVGERGGEVGSVERESDDDDAELDKVAVSSSFSRQGQPPASSRTSLELFVVLSGLVALAAPPA